MDLEPNMSTGSREKHEFIEASLQGEYLERPQYKGITVNRVTIYNHDRFAKGWLKDKDERVFQNVIIFPLKTNSRDQYSVHIGSHKFNGIHFKSTGEFSTHDVLYLESKGIIFHDNEEYKEIKKLAFISQDLGTY